jgi:hypothetical protein
MLSFFTVRLHNFQELCIPQRRAFTSLRIQKQICAPVSNQPSERVCKDPAPQVMIQKKSGCLSQVGATFNGSPRKSVQRKVTSYRCQEILCGKFYADGFASKPTNLQ